MTVTGGGPVKLRAWALHTLICKWFGHRPPARWWGNAAGDYGGWMCTRCLMEWDPITETWSAWWRD